MFQVWKCLGVAGSVWECLRVIYECSFLFLFFSLQNIHSCWVNSITVISTDSKEMIQCRVTHVYPCIQVKAWWIQDKLAKCFVLHKYFINIHFGLGGLAGMGKLWYHPLSNAKIWITLSQDVFQVFNVWIGCRATSTVWGPPWLVSFCFISEVIPH